MKIILLGGNNSTNVSWLEEMKKALKKNFEEITILHYLHWKNDKQLMNIDKEIDRLKKLLKKTNKYIIIAKSAGALIALKGMNEKVISPFACVFLGLPVFWSHKNGFEIESWLKNCTTPILYIQKSEDPAINVKELQILLQSLNTKNYEIFSMPGTEHGYSEFEEVSQKITSFLPKT